MCVRGGENTIITQKGRMCAHDYYLFTHYNYNCFFFFFDAYVSAQEELFAAVKILKQQQQHLEQQQNQPRRGR